MTKEHPSIERYRQAVDAYEAFVKHNPAYAEFVELSEELNAATAALEMMVRAKALVHPDFAPKRTALYFNADALAEMMGADTAQELGFLKPATSLEIDRDALEQAITDGFFTPTELEKFCKETVSYKVPTKVQIR